ncbi:TetR/AcrR family transcriptional regulator [Pedococcus dokdonensis]
MGRRERNKQAKLERILAAAGSLLAERSIDEVTTQEVAEAADIATGTLFLYAKTKGELLLMVQNAHYRQALDRGMARAARLEEPLEAVMAILRPIIDCNRAQRDNGVAYLREITFGDSAEAHRAEALTIVQETEVAVAAVIGRTSSAGAAGVAAHLINGAMLLALAGAGDADNDAVAAEVRQGVELVLRCPPPLPA